MNLFYRPSEHKFDERYQFENNFPNLHKGSVENDEDTIDPDSLISVSMRDLTVHFLQDNEPNFKYLVDQSTRSKLFNSTFQIWKKRDLKQSIQSYKIGQQFKAKISHVVDSRKFFVQDEHRIEDLNVLEDCIQNFVRVLLSEEDKDLKFELNVFQEKIALHDVVIVKSAIDQRWYRAIYSECMSNSSFDQYEDADDDVFEDLSPVSKKKNNHFRGNKNYQTFFLIDHGREEIYVRIRNDPNRSLYVLPINTKLIKIGCFALKCSLNESHLQTYSRIQTMGILNEEFKLQFEQRFKQALSGKIINVRISQLLSTRTELEAIVEPYYLIEDVQEEFLVNLEIKNLEEETLIVKSNKSSPMSPESLSLKLNCVNFILRDIKINNERTKSIQVLFFFIQIKKLTKTNTLKFEKGSAKYPSPKSQYQVSNKVYQ